MYTISNITNVGNNNNKILIIIVICVIILKYLITAQKSFSLLTQNVSNG